MPSTQCTILVQCSAFLASGSDPTDDSVENIDAPAPQIFEGDKM